jgi:NAD(P)-dependent dehydrogenase (short-subunit alcohol dehydrogenase family)
MKLPREFPPQKQSLQPGIEFVMEPRPISENPSYKSSGKLEGKVAIITGGDSGIGRAVAYAFAREGADLAIVYLNENADAEETKDHIKSLGRRCHLIPGDIRDEGFAQIVTDHTIDEFGKIDILVNNAGEQFPKDDISQIPTTQLVKTFETNFFGLFYLTKNVLKQMKEGGVIINNASVTAYKGSPALIDYSASKGAIVSFTRSLSRSLADRGIRVNAVAPGPIWTPLIPSTFDLESIRTFGQNTPMGRAGQPFEVAPAFVFLASNQDSSYITGQTIHVNGGTITDG